MTPVTLWGTSVTLTGRGLRLRQVMFPDQHHRANVQQSWDWSIMGTEAGVASLGSQMRVFKSYQNRIHALSNHACIICNQSSLVFPKYQKYHIGSVRLAHCSRDALCALVVTQLLATDQQLPVHINFPCISFLVPFLTGFHSAYRYCAPFHGQYHSARIDHNSVLFESWFQYVRQTRFKFTILLPQH